MPAGDKAGWILHLCNDFIIIDQCNYQNCCNHKLATEGEILHSYFI